MPFKGGNADIMNVPTLTLKSFWGKSPLWSFKYCDFEYVKWCFAESDQIRGVLKKLKAYEHQTWGDICQALGKRNTLHHRVWATEMCTEAFKRIQELNLTKLEFYRDSLFSFHLEGKNRLWGIINEGVYFIIWYDPNHEVYPVSKKFT
jgi:hypothetical protein